MCTSHNRFFSGLILKITIFDKFSNTTKNIPNFWPEWWVGTYVGDIFHPPNIFFTLLIFPFPCSLNNNTGIILLQVLFTFHSIINKNIFFSPDSQLYRFLKHSYRKIFLSYRSILYNMKQKKLIRITIYWIYYSKLGLTRILWSTS